MALPSTISATPGDAGHHPPCKSSAGNYYAVVSGTASRIAVFKASDPTDTWTQQGGEIAGNTFSIVQSGDILHIVLHSTTSVKYTSFNMGDDTFLDGTSLETVEDITNIPNREWASIAVRSDGDVVVVYAGATDQVMGGTKERVDYNVRTSGVWGGPVTLDGVAGDVHYGNPNCILGTNDFVHCLWQTTANVADPPTAWTDTQGRSIDPADDSASTVDISDANSGGALLGFPNVLSFDQVGSRQLIVSGFIADGTSLETAQGLEDGADEILLTAIGQTEDFTNEAGYINGEVGISTSAPLLEDVTPDIHCLYSGDGASGADQDLWYTKSTDRGNTWSAPTEEIDAITVNFISANIYVRGVDTVLAYVYDDGGVQKYNEKVLIAGAGLLAEHLHGQHVLQAVKRLGNF